MRIPGAKTAKTLYRWLQARLAGGALILGYHRVTDTADDGYEICVSPKHFAEQMDALRKYANIISVHQLVQYLKEGSIPARSVAVTFDDGYADNLYQAKPILENFNVPATIFVCTGFAGREFWWDELQRLVLSSTADLRGLRLDIGSSKRTQPIVSQEAGTASTDRHRKVVSQSLYRILLPLDISERNEAMAAIRKWSGIPMNETVAQRSMNHAELMQMSACKLIEIGSHTRGHAMLPKLSAQRQVEEIVYGRRDLENIIGKPVTGFSYPNGQATSEAKRILQEQEFSYACTSLQDAVRPGHDRLELTRFWQQDVDGDTFLRGLRLWLREGKS
jgi:peptidoglycan/xylan/chitin deacetylase (PgdA/CDA1 family)